MIILASKSTARAAVLTGAGIAFETFVSGVDEGIAKTALLAQGATPRDIAEALAEQKAVSVSTGQTGLVIGADQTLEFEGQVYDKAETVEAARDRLKLLRGKPHQLHSAVAVARDGVLIWREVVTCSLTMRDYSDAFLESYLAQEGQEALGSVGCYRLEGRGSQLFSNIEGDYFAILGLPLMGLLELLRRQGDLVA